MNLVPTDPSNLIEGEKPMNERTIERRLCQEIRALGGLALKFVSPGLAGVPDRLILLPGGKLAFVEVKAPGQTLRPLQVRRKAQLEALGFQVYCLGGKEQIPELINSILKER